MKRFMVMLFWFIVLAIPFTAIALASMAVLTDHSADIASAVRYATNWGALSSEASARWPEVAGMIIGQLVLMALVVIAWRAERRQERA